MRSHGAQAMCCPADLVPEAVALIWVAGSGIECNGQPMASTSIIGCPFGILLFLFFAFSKRLICQIAYLFIRGERATEECEGQPMASTSIRHLREREREREKREAQNEYTQKATDIPCTAITPRGCFARCPTFECLPSIGRLARHPKFNTCSKG